MKKARNYRKEYREYHQKHLKDNNARHRARYAAEKAGRVHVGDGKDLHHKDNNPRNNSSANIKVEPRSKNRSRKQRKI